MALLTHIDGPVDVERLIGAFETVVRQSPTLRLTIGQPADGLGDEVVVSVGVPAATEVIDLSRADSARWARERVGTPVDVRHSVYDSVVLRHDDRSVSWYLCLHHVATDATSSALVFQATAAIYHGEPMPLAELDVAPPAPSKRRQRATNFWGERPAAPIVSSLYQPIEERTTSAHRHAVDGVDLADVEAALDGPFQMISRDLAWTALLMTAVSVHLHRVSGADRFAVGLPVHNRTGADRQRMIGPLMEVYPVDVSIDPSMTHRELHASISKQLLKVVGNALPDVGANAADVSAIVNVIPRGGLGPFGTLSTSTEWIHPGAADPNHLLGVQLTTYGSASPALELDINDAGATSAQQASAVQHFATIIDATVGQPDLVIADTPLATATELERLAAWGTGASLSSRRFEFDPRSPRHTGSVIDRLSVSLSNGTRPALIDGDTTLTGQELWIEAGRVAANLRAAGIVRGQRVGVEIRRSAEAVIAILGVLRAGASYVPIDPSHPEQRRIDISDRAGVAGVLTNLETIDTSLTFDHGDGSVSIDDEAYVLFTSGSTGAPKGVPITHGGLADYLAFAAQEYLGPKQRRPVAPLFTSLGFDLTVTSLFLPLIAGGTIVVIGDDGVEGLRAVAHRSDLTWIKATPSHLELLRRLLPERHRIATMVVGGEAFSARLAGQLATSHPGLEIYNEYGPTEAVVGCMIHRFDAARPLTGDVPIGGPASGVSLRIVDAAGHDAPLGVAGELWISSAGLSPGYLGQPVDAPPFHHDGARRWYASGDIVRLTSDHTAMYLGRADDQVKLNGVRLEPAEVVAAIERHPAVGRAVVRLWRPNDDTRPMLAAWIEAADGLDPLDLRSFLLAKLASHQIPAAVAVLEELPFNRNGKLDTAALPDPERVRSNGSTETGSIDGSVADAVRTVWQRVLGLPADGPQLSPTDDFFVLGGDSLAALEMVAALSDALMVDIGEGLPFAAPEFGDFVHAVAAIEPANGSVDTPVAGEGGHDLSPGERAMLFEHRVDPTSARYNIGRRYVVTAVVDAERLRRAAEAVVARHAPLRTSFASERVVMTVGDALHFSTPSLDQSSPEPTLTDHVSRAAADALYRAPFDLEYGPLVRVALHRLDPGPDGGPRSAVVVVMHHISGDAGSLDRFWADLDAAYSGRDLDDLTVTYADHAVWQERRDRGADHWRLMWEEPVETRFGLPGATGDHAGGYVEQRASFTASRLRAGPGRTPTATALAALAKLLDRHHRSTDRPSKFAIGLTASVREHPTSEPMVGYFLNTLPLVLEVPSVDATVSDLAQVASAALAQALPHRSHPFADMVAAARREQRRLPIPAVLLAVEDLAEASLDGHEAEHEVLASGVAVAPVTVFVQIRGERVDLGIEFADGLMSHDRAHLVLDDLDALLARALDDAADRGPLPSEASAVLVGPEAAVTTPLTPSILGHIDTRSDGMAARCGAETLTWSALGRRSALLAEQLRLNGVGVGDRVAVSLPRSVDLVVALVAVLRVGAVYVPLDPTYPVERRERILRSAKPTVAVVEPGGEVEWIPNLTVPEDRQGSVIFVDHLAEPTDDAYVIFTSGSTGTPKGVSVTHGQLSTSTRARDLVYDGRPERFLLLSSIGFDSSIVGLFWTLFAGGEIVIPTEQEAHDPDALLSLIARTEVSHVLMVPSLYRALLARGASAEHWPAVVTVAGEACPADLTAQHHRLRPASALWNEYGPTEGTVWTTAHRCLATDDPVPIGRPIPGAWCAVVDEQGDPVPLGAAGELMIGGAGVVEGYLDGPADGGGPFVADAAWGPAYRTGDEVAVQTDSENGDGAGHVLRFLGRVDDQLNVGGVRLEPGEVERVLVAVEGISDAAVVAGTMGQADRLVLVAHIECDEIDVDRLRHAIAEQLPAAARPSRYVTHGELPKTAHGKVDRAALAAMELAEEPAEQLSPTAPMTATQTAVLARFRRHVKAEVGLDDGFFDAGGDSLSALTLAMDLEDHFGTEFSVTMLLSAPTARAVAASFDPEASSAPGDATADREVATSSSLVEWIRVGEEERAVLVLLAPGSGHLLGYEPLIRAIDPGTPILGVRLPGYDGKADPVPSVPALASIVGPLLDDALAARTAIAESPVVLLGGSSGGLLAWALQHRAEQSGGSFDRLVMQDTVHPDWRREQAEVGFVEDMQQRLAAGGVSAVGREVFGRADRKFKRWQRARRSEKQRAHTGAEMPEVVAQRMFAATTAGLLDYQAPDVSADVLFLAAANTDPDATFGRWRHATTSLSVEVFAGDHFGDNGITAAKNVAPVAATINKLLADLDE